MSRIAHHRCFSNQTRSEEGSPPPSGEASGEAREAPPQHVARDSADAKSADYERDKAAEASRVRALYGCGALGRTWLTLAAARVPICRTGATRSASSSATACRPSTPARSASTDASEQLICERHATEWTQ